MNAKTQKSEVEGIPWQLTGCGNYWESETDDALRFIGLDTPFAEWIAAQESASSDQERRGTDTKEYLIRAGRIKGADRRAKKPA